MTHEFALVPALLVGALISQTVSRSLLHHGFYEQVLIDDGQLARTFMPPRDLRSWRQYPVSAIANFQPVILGPSDVTAQALPAALAAHPGYERFPVGGEGDAAVGVLTARRVRGRRWPPGKTPPVHVAPTCLRDETIGNAQAKLIESSHGMVLILDAPQGKIVGLLTLHDLLRAQDALAAAE